LARTLERALGARWTVVVDTGVAPTNTRAERALRFAVLWRKMMPGTYNEKGDRWVARSLSVRETCRVRGRPPCPGRVEAVTGAFNGAHPDLAWISCICSPEPLQIFNHTGSVPTATNRSPLPLSNLAQHR
jgi:transposase